jgi:Fe2+ or Zn2+ uptake regulation protein
LNCRNVNPYAAPRAARVPLPENDALVCSYCGSVTTFHSGVPAEAWSEALSRGFVVHRHRLVLFGRCATCKANRTAEALP